MGVQGMWSGVGDKAAAAATALSESRVSNLKNSLADSFFRVSDSKLGNYINDF